MKLSGCGFKSYSSHLTKQFGVQSKDSTEHALISLIETIKKYLDDDEIHVFFISILNFQMRLGYV